MSVTLVGRSPYRRVLTYEKLLDETGREMHRSWGNAIDANEAFDRMGADVMRWQFCETPPSAEPGSSGTARPARSNGGYSRSGTRSRSSSRTPNIEDFSPSYDDLAAGRRRRSRSTAGWSPASGQLVAETSEGFDRYWTPAVTRAFEAFVDDLSNWYIRRSRRRFYSFDEAAFRTLWYAVAQGLRVIAPVMPFLADELWRNPRRGGCAGAPGSVPPRRLAGGGGGRLRAARRGRRAS